MDEKEIYYKILKCKQFEFLTANIEINYCLFALLVTLEFILVRQSVRNVRCNRDVLIDVECFTGRCNLSYMQMEFRAFDLAVV